MHIAVIGAGAGGLAVARHALAERNDNVNVTVFEQSGHLGGVWASTDSVELDEFGVPIRGCMYSDLVTNLPTQIMGYTDIPMDAHVDATAAPSSYIPGAQVLDYLERFAHRFALHAVIKFHHRVIRVHPIANTSAWQLTVRNARTQSETTDTYDAVFVCNGHYTVPFVPLRLPGRAEFEGKQMHSHEYRRADAFAGQRVLIVGSGPSGADMACLLTPVAARVCVSAHGDGADMVRASFGAEMLRPDVRRLTRTGAVFVDGCQDEFDVVLYCTGYVYRFPFLSEACGIDTADNHVQPLFKDCVHIERPTMFFLGLTSYGIPFLVMDVQARGCVALLCGRWKLPTRKKMMEIAKRDLQMRFDRGYTKRQAHKLDDFMETYVNDWTKMADTPIVRPVQFKILNHSVYKLMTEFRRFRDYRYEITGDSQFTCHRNAVQ